MPERSGCRNEREAIIVSNPQEEVAGRKNGLPPPDQLSHFSVFPERLGSEGGASLRFGAFPVFRRVSGNPERLQAVFFQFFVKGDRKSTRLNSSHVKISYA